MKTDRLEQFMRNNREAFDDLEPMPDLWNRIEEQLPARKIFPWKTYLGRAAAILIIFTSGYFFSLYITSTKQNGNSVHTEAANGISPEMYTYLEARAYYSGMITTKKNELFHLAGSNNDIKKIIEEEFALLDKDYKELEQDLADELAGEEVIEAMIQHYRIKLELLEDILHQLKTSAPAEEKEVNYVL
jgi:hypothetical protein